MIGNVMAFPDTWEEYEEDYGFTDTEQIYTNGNRLIQSFRVKQWLEHIKVSEEDELKFYYVESIDDYWIGRRLDNFYYAEWVINSFVWTHSRYLPWGEHIVDENTLWKEHTYPSEPREIPFTEWIVGFMKKYGGE